ncbi:hypothetical protein TSOC_013299 [Tetrabaena socialis]|uniref:Uncharacterized protein n=1 Tax=Tetrabaena socialis TaxID=47790 RepID=A0A2J7ZKR0_9CHLO|nr:hypothetical protein TSOC_013299 [Tetrabaena socialis]|eukprot:PNH00855.1 hypothetical protein TSOC_013299 [Tetrabaena socialis]
MVDKGGKQRSGSASCVPMTAPGSSQAMLMSCISRYDWLQRFVLQFEGNRSLALLPNYAFALPMAAHRRAQDQAQQQQQQQAGAAGAGGSGSGSAAVRAQPGASSSGQEGEEALAGGSSASPHRPPTWATR